MDRWNPGELQPHKWENCFTIDRYSWGYRSDNRVEDYMRSDEIIHTLIESVSCGGNVLINVAPMKDGTISAIEQERLSELGDWLEINGDAIYNSIPYTVQKDFTTEGVWYTSSESGTVTYAILTRWTGQTVRLGSIQYSECLNIQLLGGTNNLEYVFANPGIEVTLPPQEQVNSKYAWTVAIKAVRSDPSTISPSTSSPTLSTTDSTIASTPSTASDITIALNLTIWCLFVNFFGKKLIVKT